MSSSPKIAIIGAGIAGLSCARELQQAGINVQLFEKSRGPAGRMSTRRGQDWQCDHGAQYFTAKHPDFCAEVARWQEAGVAALWEPRITVFDDAENPRVHTETPRFVGIPSMTAPARFLANELPLTTETSIQQVQHQADGWHLRTAENGWLDQAFNTVLLAIPAPQIKPLLREPAPHLATMASKARMRACWALMLRYKTTLNLPFDAAFVNQGPLRWVACDSTKPGRSSKHETWLLHANTEWSEAHLNLMPEDIAQQLMAAFKTLGGLTGKDYTVHRWRFADIASPLTLGCVWNTELSLGMCGDWLNHGKVEGAWLSGKQLAQRVAHFYLPR